MSYDRGLQALNLKMPETIPHTEYSEHQELVKHITGIDPRVKEDEDRAWHKFYEMTNYDFLWVNNDGPEWKGRTTSMGHAEYQEGGSDFDANIKCPFKTPEEALSFDAVSEYGLPDIKERSRYFEEFYQKFQRNNPTLVIPGGYYKTLFSACIQTFGWDIFLLSVGTDPVRFGEYVLEGLFKISMANYEAWAKTNIKAFISHDDIVWTEGAVFRPDWYRKYIFPRYKKLWKPLKDKGIKVLFCSDGNFTEFIDDIVECGADGFVFEPLTSLERIVGKYGQSKVIIGNIDCRILTFGNKKDIYKEVKRCADLGRRCPGYFFAVGNHIPHNVPLENALYYFDLIVELGKR
jgi:hypothetical protein